LPEDELRTAARDFNTKKVRLKRPDTRPESTSFPHFNTKKVRLKHVAGLERIYQTRFQYQKGAIKTVGFKRVKDVVIVYFNTKKVRLKRVNLHNVLTEVSQFQYQKGAIKTLKLDVYAAGLEDFNTKKVRLKLTPEKKTFGRTSPDFNTKKVRLKQALRTRRRVFCHRFQYQKGAIKTRAGGV